MAGRRPGPDYTGRRPPDKRRPPRARSAMPAVALLRKRSKCPVAIGHSTTAYYENRIPASVASFCQFAFFDPGCTVVHHGFVFTTVVFHGTDSHGDIMP